MMRIFFRQWTALLAALSACASVSPGAAEPAPTSSGGAGAVVVGLNQVQGQLSSSQVANGSIVLVTVRVPPAVATRANVDQISGDFEGTTIPFFPTTQKDPDTYEAIVGVPLDRKTGDAKVTVFVADEGKATRTLELPFKVVDGNYPVEELQVPPRTVNPPERAMKRIKREIEQVEKIYAEVLRKKLWDGPFKMPVDSKITSSFGSRRIYNGEPRAGHPGADLRAPTGTPIRAPAPGVVVLAKRLYFTGNTVILDHGYGVFTLYAHMSKFKVRAGQQVKAGKVLGLAGMTGRANGPHLHWGAIVHGVKVNPIDLTKVLM